MDDKTYKDGDQKELIIWTEAYSPLIMGGDVHAPIGTYATGTVRDLLKGFRCAVVTGPSGKEYVAEYKSGAIVGNDVDVVNADIEAGDVEVMLDQVRTAVARSHKVRVVSLAEFWSRMERDNE